MSDNKTDKEKINLLLQEKIVEQTYMLATYMMFIEINHLEDQFEDFANTFDEFMTDGLGTSGDLTNEFREYLKEHKGDNTRDA